MLPKYSGTEFLFINWHFYVFFRFGTDSSSEDASFLDESSNKNGEGDGVLLLQPGGSRQFIADLPGP
jgi:hypothetical protein